MELGPGQSVERSQALGEVLTDEHAQWWKPPVAIAPPRPDGATRIGIEVATSTWDNPSSTQPALYAFCEMVKRLRRPMTYLEEQEEKQSGPRIEILPVGDSWVPVEVKVGGVRRQFIQLEAKDRVYISIHMETGDVFVQFRAKEMWKGPWEEAFRFWIEGLSRTLLGQEVRLEKSHQVGWRVTTLELCADFLRLDMGQMDRHNFSGKYRTSGSNDKLGRWMERDEDGEPIPWRDAETIDFGSRAGNVSFCIYNKLRQMQACARRGKSNLPNYRAAWGASGVDVLIDEKTGAPIGPEIRRVEIRFCNRGLELIEAHEDRVAVASEYNLRDPWKVCQPKLLARAWIWATRHCLRLTVPPPEGTSCEDRMERRPTDSRWEVVQKAALQHWPARRDCSQCGGRGVSRADGNTICGCVTPRLKQSRRLHEHAHEEKVRRATRNAARSLAQVEALLGIEANTLEASGIVAQFARWFSLERHGDSYERYRRTYGVMARGFVGHEIDSEGPPQMRKFVKKKGLDSDGLDEVRYEPRAPERDWRQPLAPTLERGPPESANATRLPLPGLKEAD